MALSLGRMKYFTIGLIKDAISWTPAPLDDKMKTTLVDCLRIAQDKNFQRDDFMKVRSILTQGGLYTAPPSIEDKESSKPKWRVVGYNSERTEIFVHADTSLEAMTEARAQGIEGISYTSPAVKKYRIINLDTNAEWEADTSDEVWRIIYTEISNLDIYEVRYNLTNEIVPEFILL